MRRTNARQDPESLGELTDITILIQMDLIHSPSRDRSLWKESTVTWNEKVRPIEQSYTLSSTNRLAKHYRAIRKGTEDGTIGL